MVNNLKFSLWNDRGQDILDISSLGDHFVRLRCTVDMLSQFLYDKTVDVGKLYKILTKPSLLYFLRCRVSDGSSPNSFR